jgi:hypothetical protein
MCRRNDISAGQEVLLIILAVLLMAAAKIKNSRPRGNKQGS